MPRTWYEGPCGVHQFLEPVRRCERCDEHLSEILGEPAVKPPKKVAKVTPNAASRRGNQTKRPVKREKRSKKTSSMALA